MAGARVQEEPGAAPREARRAAAHGGRTVHTLAGNENRRAELLARDPAQERTGPRPRDTRDLRVPAAPELRGLLLLGARHAAAASQPAVLVSLRRAALPLLLVAHPVRGGLSDALLRQGLRGLQADVAHRHPLHMSILGTEMLTCTRPLYIVYTFV